MFERSNTITQNKKWSRWIWYECIGKRISQYKWIMIKYMYITSYIKRVILWKKIYTYYFKHKKIFIYINKK